MTSYLKKVAETKFHLTSIVDYLRGKQIGSFFFAFFLNFWTSSRHFGFYVALGLILTDGKKIYFK